MIDSINNSISKINTLLNLISFIPKSFDTLQSPVGIDQDLYEEMVYNFKHKVTPSSDKDFLDYFVNIEKTLDIYLEVFNAEMKRLIFIQYTTPESVKDIMNLIGTKGVLNTDQGLFIYQKYSELKLNKKDYLVKNNDFIFVIDEKDFLNYKSFNNKFKN